MGCHDAAWSSVQVTHQGAEAHKDTSNKPGTFNYAIIKRAARGTPQLIHKALRCLEDHATDPFALCIMACYAGTEVTEPSDPNGPVDTTIWETSPDDNNQENGVVFSAALFDYHKAQTE